MRIKSARQGECVFDFANMFLLLGHAETKPVVSYVGDVCEPETIERAFVGGVDCVFHCAAYVNFQFPPNLEELERVNVNGELNRSDKEMD